MFYRFIDENTIRKAPKPLNIGGKDVFTNSEGIYNEQGYFRLAVSDYPQGEKCYTPKYILADNKIIQTWHEIPDSEVPKEEPLESEE